MVSTRHHPQPFPKPVLSPSRTSPSTRSTTSDPDTSPSATSSSVTRSKSTKSQITSKSIAYNPSVSVSTSSILSTSLPKASGGKSYTHTPPPLLIVWLLVSLPLVIWDTLYVLFRPHTMPGGKFHSPLWTPYALYGTVDYMYGWPAWEAKNGFTAAQGSLNALETALYAYYLFVLGKRTVTGDGFVRGVVRRLPLLKRQSTTGDAIVVQGTDVAGAVLLCFACSVMTLSKTVLYWLNEAFGSFHSIGHNSPWTLFWLWIVPNGAWIVLPTYMTYVLGKEIMDGLYAGSSDEEMKEE